MKLLGLYHRDIGVPNPPVLGCFMVLRHFEVRSVWYGSHTRHVPELPTLCFVPVGAV